MLWMQNGGSLKHLKSCSRHSMVKLWVIQTPALSKIFFSQSIMYHRQYQKTTCDYLWHSLQQVSLGRTMTNWNDLCFRLHCHWHDIQLTKLSYIPLFITEVSNHWLWHLNNEKRIMIWRRSLLDLCSRCKVLSLQYQDIDHSLSSASIKL